MARGSWFGNKKAELDRLEREAAQRAAQEAAKAQAELELRKKITHVLNNDPRFGIKTFDQLSWVCPYTGRILNAPFDTEATILRYLMNVRPFANGTQPKSVEQLRLLAWQHYLREALNKDARLGHFVSTSWLNPFTGEWLEKVPLGAHGAILPNTVQHLATILNECKQSNKRQFINESTIHARLRDKMRDATPLTIHHQGAVYDDDEVAIFAETESEIILPGTEAIHKTASDQDTTRPPCKDLADLPLNADLPAEPQPKPADVPGNITEKNVLADSDSARARSVQSHILPTIPQFDHIRIGAFYRPHDAVSGDFYDFQTLPDGRILITLCDVSGHGVQAGLVVHSTIKSLRFICKLHSNLSQIVTKLNEELLDDLLKDQFVTGWFLVIDPQNFNAECLWCGHHPMLAARPSNDAYLNIVGQNGGVLGMLRSELFTRTISPLQLHLQPGDIFMQYTDGATEAMNEAREEFGEHRFYGRFVTHVLDQQKLSAQELADQLGHDVLAYGNQVIDDDLTILVIEVLEQSVGNKTHNVEFNSE